jgi:hypothetical protein
MKEQEVKVDGGKIAAYKVNRWLFWNDTMGGA